MGVFLSALKRFLRWVLNRALSVFYPSLDDRTRDDQ